MKGVIPGRDMEAPAVKAASWSRENEVDMYTFNSRVRYSETDEGGCLSVSGIINYMQDCSTFQSEDCGVGVGYLEASHKAWLLSSWQIMIDRYPGLGRSWWLELGIVRQRGYTATVTSFCRTGRDGCGQG